MAALPVGRALLARKHGRPSNANLSAGALTVGEPLRIYSARAVDHWRRRMVGRASAATSTSAAFVPMPMPEAPVDVSEEGVGAGLLSAGPSFSKYLRESGQAVPLRREDIATVQVNIGLYCNQACAHCHVDSSPQRTEMMDRATAQKIVELMEASPAVEMLDLTGGAPELNSQFRFLVAEATRLGKQVIDRCNLTVLFEPGQEDLAEFLAAHKVRVVASLPCYSADNVDKQRGRGVFEESIEALQILNRHGYGKEGTGLILDLVYNPIGPSLPPPQSKLEEAYKSELQSCYGIEFNGLLTITNMPIKRFGEDLERKGKLEEYMNLLAGAFNPAAVPNVMCRHLVNIKWDGALFDCDFNQQLELGLPTPNLRTVFDLKSFEDLVAQPIAVGPHCFGCTAGQGSSCTGAVV